MKTKKEDTERSHVLDRKPAENCSADSSTIPLTTKYRPQKLTESIRVDLGGVGLAANIKIKKLIIDCSGFPHTPENKKVISEKLNEIDFGGTKLKLHSFGAPGEIYFEEA